MLAVVTVMAIATVVLKGMINILYLFQVLEL